MLVQKIINIKQYKISNKNETRQTSTKMSYRTEETVAERNGL